MQSTHVVSIIAAQVERFDEIDVGIADHSGVVKVILTDRGRKPPMGDEDVSRLGFDGGEFLAGWDMGVERVLERRVQTLGVIVEVLANL
jgi:hypothetical protein